MMYVVRIAALVRRLAAGLMTGAGMLRPFAVWRIAVFYRVAGRSGRIPAGTALPVPGVHAAAGETRHRQVYPILFAMLMATILPSAAQAVPPGTVITNSAQAQFSVNSLLVSVPSNSVSLTTTVSRTPSTLELFQYSPVSPATSETVTVSDYRDSGGAFQAMNPPVEAGGNPIDTANPVPLAPTDLYHQGSPFFVKVTDMDQNLDPGLIETVLVTLTDSSAGEAEIVRMYETSSDSGVFVGYIQSGPPPVDTFDGVLNVSVNSQISAVYTDPADGTDSSSMAALVDPLGVVFDSATGQPVNGVSIALVEVDGAGSDIGPATVLGDDGTSTFPATVITGGTVTDSGGNIYTFPPGGFRFPLVPPGNYRFDVVPVSGSSYPSSVPYPALQASWGSVFAIVDPGSKGEIFIINPGPIVNIDLPIDSLAVGLFASKSSNRDVVGIGDFLQYAVNVSNVTGSTATGLEVTDYLPQGFRYQPGSTRIEGIPSPDPVISATGRNLTFSLPELPGGSSVGVRYVVEVGAGSGKGPASNTASATAVANGVSLTSNTAAATVRIREDLFRDRAHLVGRVTAGACGEEGIGGLEGVRIFLEDGTFVVTDEQGRYHIEGIRPGTHVVQLDKTTIPEKYEIVDCAPNGRSAGTPFSRFMEVQGGTLWREDFQAILRPKAQGKAVLELRSVLEEDGIQYLVLLDREDVPISNLRLTIQLPEGVRYKEGTSRLDGQPVDDPSASNGTLTWRLEDIPADGDGDLRFETIPVEDWSWSEGREVDIPPESVKYTPKRVIRGELNEVVSKAIITFDTPEKKNQRTPVIENVLMRVSEEDITRAPRFILHPSFETLSAALAYKDRALLDTLARDIDRDEVVLIYIEGHSDDRPIRERSRHIYADNYELSLARARSVSSYLAEALNLPPYMFASVGKGPDEPMAPNDTEEGRAVNRRVEVRVITQTVLRRSSVEPFQDRGRAEVVTIGLRPGEKMETTEAPTSFSEPDPLKDFSWLENADSRLQWTLPPEGWLPSIPSTKIAVKHSPETTVVLLLDGKEVSPLNFQGTVVNGRKTAKLSIWRGVDLAFGDNHFEAIVYDGAGEEVDRVERTLHCSSPPVRAEIVPEKSRLVANGRDAPIVAVRLTDEDGYPARMGVIGTFSVDPPNESHEDTWLQDPITGVGNPRSQYSVGEDGIVLLKLKPTTRTGEAVLHMTLLEGDVHFKVWLAPEARDWILVGLAEGTAGYNTLSGNMEELDPAGAEEDLYADGKVAFFAKGQVKGKWLVTAAYDSSKDRDGVGDRLFQTIDPDMYYTLYGDGARQDYEAESSDKLYLKIERRQFYALYGDFRTDMAVTELSRYNRSMTGLKSELRSDRYSYNLFAADTDYAFLKDEIRGDGTSGLYRLSNPDVVINSEKVTIEVRDRFHSERIISSTQMTRHIDYNVDYLEGTLYFKRPIPSRDQNFNPIFIVVDYETLSSDGTQVTAGGRGAVKLGGAGGEVGVSYIHEGTTGKEGDLAGVDATVNLGDGTHVRAEIAASRKEKGGSDLDGAAYIAELVHQSGRLTGSVYAREQDADFGLGQQNNSESGTRKYGLDASYRINGELTAGGLAYRQFNLVTGEDREVEELSLNYSRAKYSLRTDVRQAVDTRSDGAQERSNQLGIGGSWTSGGGAFVLRADHEQSLNGNANQDFPTRTILGADYRVNKALTLYGEQEFTYGDERETSMTRVGMKANPWQGGEARSSIQRDFNENGSRVFAVMGLVQMWRINEKWMMDAGFEQSTTVGESYRPLHPDVPPASGTQDGEDFWALSLGTSYKYLKWLWNARLELRDSELDVKWGVLTDVFGEPKDRVGISAEAVHYRTEYSMGGDRKDTGLRFGLVYRPLETRWILLDRLDFLFENEVRPGESLDSRRVVNNFNANFQPSLRNQLALQYAFKFVDEQFDGISYSGFTDLIGVENRYSITEKWDLGVQLSALHSWNSSTMEYSAGLSVGYYLFKNAWLSLGYNFAGFEDGDFAQGSYRGHGPFLRFRIKADQESLRAILKSGG